jgi:hypothetical protein
MWRRAGWRLRAMRALLEEGVERVRARLHRADGAVRLAIHPRCERLIESLSTYHYPPQSTDGAAPVKDGPDHCADALRYLVVNHDGGQWDVRVRDY